MAASDKLIPYTNKVSVIALTDATAVTPLTITVLLQQGGITWTEPGKLIAEPRNRGTRPAAPIILETDDQNVTGSISALVTSYLGDSALTLKEWFNMDASLTSTSSGGATTVTMTVTCNDGVSQVLTFALTRFSNVQIDTNGQDGMTLITADFTSLIDAPTAA